jgi:hypothetical protein
VSIIEGTIQESTSQSDEISENANAIAGIYLPKAQRIPHFQRRGF